MKLLHHITLRLSMLTILVIILWSVPFYYALIEEVNDETDDALEEMAEVLIKRSLAGEDPAPAVAGSNNQFRLRDVSETYAATHNHITYEDKDVYVPEMREYEPARAITYIFRDGQGKYHELEVFTPHIEKADLRETIFQWMLSLALTLLLGIVLLNAISMHHTLRPLRKLLNWTDNFQLRQKNPPLENPTNILEFRQLNESVEQSMLRNQRQYESQKTFIGLASHELQTPLAVCLNRLEMLLDDPSLGEQQAAEVAKTINTLTGMARQNRTLLTLSRIENGQFSDRETVSFQALSETILPDMQAIYQHQDINVESRWDADFCPTMDPTLARMLLTNLLKNAFVHNRPKGNISIQADSHALRIANTGQDHPLDCEHIFEPFYHTPGNHHSTGLGLALVKAICRHSGLSISYEYVSGRHSFRLSERQKVNES